MIEIKRLTKQADTKLILRNIDLSIKKGETVAILGPNGAGKSTLLKVIATLIKPTSGEIKINGFDLKKNSHDIKKTITDTYPIPACYMIIILRLKTLFSLATYMELTMLRRKLWN